MRIRLGVRASRLARAQADVAVTALRAAGFTAPIDILALTSEGDRLPDQSLADHGGKGLFTRTIDEALRQGEVDLAVHSLKDLPVNEGQGTVLLAVLPGDDPRDALILPKGKKGKLDDLQSGAVVGTASPRRQAFLAVLRPDLRFRLLRGNVETRLAKLDAGEVDATMLAVAGLERLGLADRVSMMFSTEQFIPSANQGVIGLVAREGDGWIGDMWTRRIDDERTRIRVEAERAVLLALGASCISPVGVFGVVDEGGGRIDLRAALAAPSGTGLLEERVEGEAGEAVKLGRLVGESLRERSLAEHSLLS